MILIVQLTLTLLIINFIISSVIVIYCKIFKKETKAFFGMVISLVALVFMTEIRNHLIKNELIKDIKDSKIEQKASAFSKEELTNITTSDERHRKVDKDIYLVLLPAKDTIYLNQDCKDNHKFWIHYKKYEFFKMTASVGYILKN